MKQAKKNTKKIPNYRDVVISPEENVAGTSTSSSTEILDQSDKAPSPPTAVPEIFTAEDDLSQAEKTYQKKKKRLSSASSVSLESIPEETPAETETSTPMTKTTQNDLPWD